MEVADDREIERTLTLLSRLHQDPFEPANPRRVRHSERIRVKLRVRLRVRLRVNLRVRGYQVLKARVAFCSGATPATR